MRATKSIKITLTKTRRLFRATGRALRKLHLQSASCRATQGAEAHLAVAHHDMPLIWMVHPWVVLFDAGGTVAAV